ncbi:MAG: hypothetical protein WCO58_00245 [bacterium]
MSPTEVFKSIGSLKISHPFRDIIVLIYGIGAILIFQYLSIFQTSDYIPKNLNRIEFDLFFLVIGFILGKLLLIISDLIFSIESKILRLLSSNPKIDKKTLSSLKINIFRILNNFLIDKKYENIRQTDVEHEITIADKAELIQKYPDLHHESERIIYLLFFIRIAVAVTLFISFFYSWKFIYLFLIFLLIWHKNKNELIYNDHLMYRSIVKSKIVK